MVHDCLILVNDGWWFWNNLSHSLPNFWPNQYSSQRVIRQIWLSPLCKENVFPDHGCASQAVSGVHQYVVCAYYLYNHVIWYYMILYNIIWYYINDIIYMILYMILYDIIWYYMILYVYIYMQLYFLFGSSWVSGD